MNVFKGHYVDWRTTRFEFLKKHFGVEFFNGKTLLELGCGYGDLGNMFAELGAKVTGVDARPEHLELAKHYYPHSTFECHNLDEDFSLPEHDIILHTGLLYHLENPVKHLHNLRPSVGGVLILDAKVVDSNDPTFVRRVADAGIDSSVSGHSVVPSEACLDKTLLELFGTKVSKILDASLNSTDLHIYDWQSKNTRDKLLTRNRLWICEI